MSLTDKAHVLSFYSEEVGKGNRRLCADYTTSVRCTCGWSSKTVGYFGREAKEDVRRQHEQDVILAIIGIKVTLGPSI